MNALRGLALLLLLQALGESLAHALSLPFPGPVIGLVLLLPLLHWPGVRESVSAVAEFLLAHLSLLFVPVGVGVIASGRAGGARRRAPARDRAVDLARHGGDGMGVAVAAAQRGRRCLTSSSSGS